MSNKIMINIEGMHCQSCVSKVESSLLALSGVTSVEVDLNAKKAEIEYTDKEPSAKEIRRAVDKVGFLVV